MNLLIRKHVTRQRGQALVELALSLTVLLIMVLAGVDFGLQANQSAVVPKAARAGALLLTPSNNQDGVDVRPVKAFQEVIRSGSGAFVDLHQDAQISVSYIQLQGGRARITRQYHKNPGISAESDVTPIYPSRLGEVNADVTAQVPVNTLYGPGDWIVALEIFYKVNYISPIPRLLGMATNEGLIYERAIY